MSRLPKLLPLLGCAVLVLGAAPALAKKKGKKKPAFGPVTTVVAVGNTSTPGQVSTATATCPAGRVAVGGGYSAPFNDDTRVGVFESQRSAPGSWTVSAINREGTGAATAYAYCRVARRAITVVSASGAVPGAEGAVGAAEARCPANAHLIGGAFSLTRGPGDSQFALPQSNFSPSAGTWSVTAVNNTNGPQTLTAIAYCATKIKAPTILSSQISPTLPEFATATATTPACPKPSAKKKKKKKGTKKPLVRHLSGGGFASPPGTLTSAIPVYVGSQASNGQWLATATNVNPTAFPLPITSQAICL